MRRPVNQDSFACLNVWGSEAVLLIVCDGMGGHKAGEIASQKAVSVFCDKIVSSPCVSETPEQQMKDIRYTMIAAATEANKAIFKMSGENEEYQGMGTTLVAAIIFKNKLYAINIGDSRLYITTKHEALQITKDHSFVQYLIDNGKLTQEEAKYYPRKNVITRAVGINEKVQIDFFYVHLKNWDSGYLLLCTDGLSNYADSKTILNILFGTGPKPRPSPELDLSKKAEQLIAYANSCGGSDNITAVLAKF